MKLFVFILTLSNLAHAKKHIPYEDYINSQRIGDFWIKCRNYDSRSVFQDVIIANTFITPRHGLNRSYQAWYGGTGQKYKKYEWMSDFQKISEFQLTMNKIEIVFPSQSKKIHFTEIISKRKLDDIFSPMAYETDSKEAGLIVPEKNFLGKVKWRTQKHPQTHSSCQYLSEASMEDRAFDSKSSCDVSSDERRCHAYNTWKKFAQMTAGKSVLPQRRTIFKQDPQTGESSVWILVD